MNLEKVSAVALRAAVGALFLLTGYLKLLSPASNFAGAIMGYQIVDLRTAEMLALALPWIEFIMGVFFCLGLWSRETAKVLLALNMLFILAITSVLWRHIPIRDCGCFGEGSHAIPIQGTLAIDTISFFALIYLLRQPDKAVCLSLDRSLKD